MLKGKFFLKYVLLNSFCQLKGSLTAWIRQSVSGSLIELRIRIRIQKVGGIRIHTHPDWQSCFFLFMRFGPVLWIWFRDSVIF
jgi:hypothetical protein